jgi:hypothetical protein
VKLALKVLFMLVTCLAIAYGAEQLSEHIYRLALLFIIVGVPSYAITQLPAVKKDIRVELISHNDVPYVAVFKRGQSADYSNALAVFEYEWSDIDSLMEATSEAQSFVETARAARRLTR